MATENAGSYASAQPRLRQLTLPSAQTIGEMHITGPFTPSGFKSVGLKVYTAELNLQLSTDKPYLSSSMGEMRAPF